MNYYVYRHRRNDTNEVFYVGIGKRNRAKSKRYRNLYWHNTVNKYGYTVEVIQENITWEEACEFEIFLISLYGRKDLGTGCLVNMTDGGEGVTNISEEQREKKRIARTGSNSPMYGKISPFKDKKHSEENLKMMSEIKQGNKNPRFGVKLSEETKQRLSKNRKGKHMGAEHQKSKLIVDTETGLFYYSIAEAAHAKNMNRNTLASKKM